MAAALKTAAGGLSDTAEGLQRRLPFSVST
jgi:hypothetical protein